MKAIGLAALWTVSAVLAVSAIAGEAHAQDALAEYLGPRELSVGEAGRANARGTLSTILNPSGLSLASELVFEAAFGYRAQDGAKTITATGCDSTVRIPGCYYYRYFGASPELGDTEHSRRTHEGGIALSRAFTPRVHVGVNVRYFDYESDVPGAEADDRGFTGDIGVTVLATNTLGLGAVGHNLLGTESLQYPRAVGAGLIARPLPTLTLQMDGLWHLDVDDGESTGRYGGGAELFLRSGDRQTGYPIRAGAVYDARGEAAFLSGGIGMVSAKFGLDIAARVQIDGGDEFTLAVGLRMFGPRQAQPAPGAPQGF